MDDMTFNQNPSNDDVFVASAKTDFKPNKPKLVSGLLKLIFNSFRINNSLILATYKQRQQ
jgi:hypothetical protein